LIVPDESVVTIEQALNLPQEKVVLMCTGSQGEPSSIIGRLSTSSNRYFDVEPLDTIVLSSHPIPGNEESISRTINRLLRFGANVIYDSIAPVHVSGHASQEEQKLLLNLVRPKHFMPVHGELRQLKRHAFLAKQVGIEEKDIVVVENGQVVELLNGKISLGERIPGGYIFVEGGSIGEVDTEIMREREQLSRSGIFLINLSIDKRSGKLVNEPEIITHGFISPEDAEEIIPATRKKIVEVANRGSDDIAKQVTSAIKSHLYNETRRRPMVFVTVSKS
jgi:ribonuclease J